MTYIATQIHPRTAKAIRQVRVEHIGDGTATVTALNGPMRGSTYEVSRGQLRGTCDTCGRNDPCSLEDCGWLPIRAR